MSAGGLSAWMFFGFVRIKSCDHMSLIIRRDMLWGVTMNAQKPQQPIALSAPGSILPELITFYDLGGRS